MGKGRILTIGDQRKCGKRQLMKTFIWIHFVAMIFIHMYFARSTTQTLQMISLALVMLYFAVSMCSSIHFGNDNARDVVMLLNTLMSFKRAGKNTENYITGKTL
jgi:hypothetical protein